MKTRYYLLILSSISTLASHAPTEEDLSAIMERMDVDEPMDLPAPRGTKRKSDEESPDEEISQTRKRVRVRRSASGHTSTGAAKAMPKVDVCKPIAQPWTFAKSPRDDAGIDGYEVALHEIVQDALGKEVLLMPWRTNIPSSSSYVIFEPNAGQYQYIEEEHKDMAADITNYLGKTIHTPMSKESFMQKYASTYKIHLSVKPEFMAWTIKEFIKTIKEHPGLEQYRFKILAVDPSLSKKRTAPSIVFYIPELVYNSTTGQIEMNPGTSPENIQKLFDIFYHKFQHCTEIAGYPLQHNCGGPVVWVAGGHADLKPGGKFFEKSDQPELLEAYREIGTVNGRPNYPYYIDQAPIQVHSGVCSEITG